VGSQANSNEDQFKGAKPVNPQKEFCPNLDCHARGHVGKGNISLHSREEERFRCSECGRTFSIRKGSIFYRLRTDPKIVMIVITLLAYGCPPKGIEKAYGFHERTIRRWWLLSGEHHRAMHEHFVGKSQLELEQVQADEIKGKGQKTTFWIAMAMMVRTRLWLGGAISHKRDLALIQDLADQLRQLALCQEMLLAVDGLVSYVKAFQTPFKGERGGRHRLIAWQNIAIVQVVKQRQNGKLSIDRRIIQGCEKIITRLIEKTQGGRGYRWVKRTPAMAAGLADQCWTVEEIFLFKVPPPHWKPPKRRGRYSKATLELIKTWA